jgi:hypothetical protein
MEHEKGRKILFLETVLFIQVWEVSFLPHYSARMYCVCVCIHTVYSLQQLQLSVVHAVQAITIAHATTAHADNCPALTTYASDVYSATIAYTASTTADATSSSTTSATASITVTDATYTAIQPLLLLLLILTLLASTHTLVLLPLLQLAHTNNNKQGCTHAPLMLLKRVGATEGVISRQASGLTLDFPLGDSTHYLVGTEDGLIHKCSVSYSEQYLETYRCVCRCIRHIHKFGLCML